MPSKDDFRAAGLYDPEVHSEGLLEMLDWLADRDFSLDEMVEALEAGALGALAADRALVPTPMLPRAEAIEVSGLAPEHFDEISTAFGYVPLTVSPSADVGYTRGDAEAFASLDRLASLFNHDESLSLIRVFGAAVTRMADAAVSMFLSEVESQHIEQDGTDLELALKGLAGVEALDGTMAGLEPVMRRHVMQAIERSRRATIDWEERIVYRYSIGFVDLVGFTSLSGEMDGRELATFLRDFEARAFEVVTQAGARVVKLIGDEVMFAATDPADACRAARGLMEAFVTTDDEVLPRGGLAFGEVLVRGGDYYGSIVNLASRLVDEAVPQEVLVTGDFVDAAPGCTFLPAGRRMVRGFPEPITVWSMEA
ncbi:MAG: adenylate/guanylate cyclase domain-containing protein [Ilumatobacteraceae bacterium]